MFPAVFVLKAFGSFFVMMFGVQVMAMRNLRMHCRFFMLAVCMMFCSQLVMIRGMLMVLCGFLVRFGDLIFTRHGLLRWMFCPHDDPTERP